MHLVHIHTSKSTAASSTPEFRSVSGDKGTALASYLDGLLQSLLQPLKGGREIERAAVLELHAHFQ